jgi:hypothetical protein
LVVRCARGMNGVQRRGASNDCNRSEDAQESFHEVCSNADVTRSGERVER